MLKAVFRGVRPFSGVRKILARRKISKFVKPNSKILYFGADGGRLIHNLASNNEIHYLGSSYDLIPKGITCVDSVKKSYYDYVIITDLQDVIDDVFHLQLAYSCLKHNGKAIIWLSNPNAHALLSWLMIMRMLGKKLHIRYYTKEIEKLLKKVGFRDVLYEKCNLHLNIIVTCEK